MQCHFTTIQSTAFCAQRPAAPTSKVPRMMVVLVSVSESLDKKDHATVTWMEPKAFRQGGKGGVSLCFWLDTNDKCLRLPIRRCTGVSASQAPLTIHDLALVRRIFSQTIVQLFLMKVFTLSSQVLSPTSTFSFLCAHCVQCHYMFSYMMELLASTMLLDHCCPVLFSAI